MTEVSTQSGTSRFGLGVKIKAIVAVLLLLLLGVSTLSFFTLQRLGNEVTEYAEQTLPALAASIELNNSLEEVVQNAEQLVSSDVQAQRRISFGATQNALSAIDTLLASRTTLVDFKEIQPVLAILADTTSELNRLIENRIDLSSRLDQHRTELGTWVVDDHVGEIAMIDAEPDAAYIRWLERENQLVRRVITLATSDNFRSQQRLLPTIQRSLRALESATETLPPAAQQEARARLTSLESQLGPDVGIVPTLRSLSQVDVRARALERQMRVLVAELLRKTDGLASERSSAAQLTAQSMARQSEQQLAGLLVGAIIALAIAIFSFIYIDRRMLARLTALSDAVIDRASGGTRTVPTLGDDEVGEIGKAVEYFVDEIDKRQTQLVESAEQTNAIIRLSPQAMCIATEDEVLYHNNAFQALWEDEETGVKAPKETILDIVPDHLLSAFGEPGERSVARHAAPGKNGSTRWFAMTSSPVEWHGTKARQLIVVDTSKQVQVEHTLEEARRKAEAAAQAKSNFLAMMSHEIRSPMNGIISVGEMLAKSDLDEEQDQLVTVINQSAETLLTILDDVLDLSKIEAGKLQISTHDFVLPAMITGVTDLLHESFRQKSINFDVMIDETVPHHVVGDSNRIRQIMYNLLNNALKFTPGGTVTVKASAQITSTDKCTVRLAVSDTGIGINPRMMSRLFQPFEQADSSVARKFGGTGLGLSICRRLANLMGGEIIANSAEGKGSTFTLVIPLKIAANVPVAAPGVADIVDTKKTGSQETNPKEKPRILVVEDNKINQLVIGKILKSLGHEWDTADDGEKALEIYNPARHDIVLTDLRMPHMDGFALASAIRASETNGARVPIVAISADAMEEAKDRSIESGIDRFLTKPVKLGDVKDCLDAFI